MFYREMDRLNNSIKIRKKGFSEYGLTVKSANFSSDRYNSNLFNCIIEANGQNEKYKNIEALDVAVVFMKKSTILYIERERLTNINGLDAMTIKLEYLEDSFNEWDEVTSVHVILDSVRLDFRLTAMENEAQLDRVTEIDHSFAMSNLEVRSTSYVMDNDCYRVKIPSYNLFMEIHNANEETDIYNAQIQVIVFNNNDKIVMKEDCDIYNLIHNCTTTEKISLSLSAIENISKISIRLLPIWTD